MNQFRAQALQLSCHGTEHLWLWPNLLEALDESPIDFVKLFVRNFKMLVNGSEIPAFVFVLAHEVFLHIIEEVGLCNFDLCWVTVLLWVRSDTLRNRAFIFKPYVDKMFQLIKASKLVIQA